MRGEAHHQPALFSYVSLEERVPRDHPLRKLRVLVDAMLAMRGCTFVTVPSLPTSCSIGTVCDPSAGGPKGTPLRGRRESRKGVTAVTPLRGRRVR